MDKPGAPNTILDYLSPRSLPWVRVDFTADEDATFECSLDGADFAPCTSPFSLQSRAFGEAHTLSVRATDLDGNADETPLLVAITREAVAYTTLSETGLYSDFDNRVLAPGVVEFAPTYSLWVDGAQKIRWVRLPPGAQVDTSDMDGWNLPVGTQFFKEFRSPDGTLLETRLIEHRGAGGNAQVDDRPDLWIGSFVWRAGDADADFAPDGVRNVKGTNHDAPRDDECYLCHQGQPDWGMGFSAVQLSREGSPGELTLQWLADEGLLSDPPPVGVDYPVPGNTIERRALGFLHSNCGHCHNPRGLAWQAVQMQLLLRTSERTVVESALYQTTVGQELENWVAPGGTGIDSRIAAGSATLSGLYYRAASREFEDQMPPLQTEATPDAALADLATWIGSL